MPDEPVEEVIAFNNPTTGILEIADIQLTPPLAAEEVTRVILPGGEGSFRLVLGPDRQYGDFQGHVRVNFKDNAHPPFTLTIEGFVIPPIEFVPIPAFLVGTRAGESRTDSIEIINHRDEPLYLVAAESESERFELELETIEEGRRYRLSLTLDGTKPPGDSIDEILLRADSGLEQPLMIQAKTRIRERVYHFPDSVDMGGLPFSVAKDTDAVQTLSQILMVYRPGTDDFEVEASIDLDYIELVSERGPDGDRYQMTLTLLPEKVSPGPIEGTVRIETNDEEFPVLEVPVSGYILEK